MERPTLSETEPKIRIILPPPRATKIEHEVASATGAGIGREQNGDAVSIFTLGVPSEDWNGVVLAVADGRGWAGRGDLASAVAVEALEDGLTGWTDHLEFTSSAWQEPVAQAFASAFEQANAKVRAQVAGEPGHGVALTAAALLGNWLCLAHAGDSRVYRLSRSDLEQLTSDHGRLKMGRSRAAERSSAGSSADGALDDRPVRALGLAAHVTPVVRFTRVKTGDVVLVCSNGLCRHLDGEDLAQVLGGRRPVEEIAQALVATASERGGDDDMSACVARVGRLPAKPLPEPAGRVNIQPVAEPVAPLPRYRARVASPPVVQRLLAVLGAVMLAAGAAGGFWYWWSTRDLSPAVVLADTVRLQQSGSDLAAAPVPTPPIDTSPPPPITLPSADTATAARPGELVPGDSLEAIQRQINDLRERRRKDSVSTAQRQRDEQRVRDSISAATRDSAAAEQRRRDSIETATQQEEARQRQAAAAAATARAEQEERDKREAQARADREAADRAADSERVKNERIAAGRNALSGWMNSLVSNVNAGNVGAPVITAGPPAFAAFVGKYKPRLNDAKLSGVTVDEESAQATAEWVAKWRGEFGATASRRMKAVVTLAPDGEVWRLRSWRITEGAP